MATKKADQKKAPKRQLPKKGEPQEQYYARTMGTTPAKLMAGMGKHGTGAHMAKEPMTPANMRHERAEGRKVERREKRTGKER